MSTFFGDADGFRFLTGVGGLRTFALAPTSDFLGLPLLLTGDESSSPLFNGTVVVFLRSTCLTVGDAMFSSPLPGSASTVTLMRQGLASPALPVFRIMDLDGDENCCITCSEMDLWRLCLLGEDVTKGDFDARAATRVLSLFDVKEACSGSGDESGDETE
jgi:hypothetical protein